MTPLGFREVFHIIHNLDLSDLEQAGVIDPANGVSDWRRFNNDIGTFVLKLPADRLDKLVLLIERRRQSDCGLKPAGPRIVFFDFEDRSGETF